MPNHSEHIGGRVREVRRRRGMTQRELAKAARVSVSLVSKLEQGELTDTRLETARRLAVALRVPTTRLVQRGEPSERVAEYWQPLQRAVEVESAQPPEEPTVQAVRQGLAGARAAYFESRMGDLSDLLVPLLREADALGESADARNLRSHLLHLAGSTLTQAHQFGAAETALRRAMDDATDRLRGASVITTWSWLLLRQGRFEESRQLATRWADDVEPRPVSRATPEELAAWGWLLVQASAASLRDNRPGEAADTMRLARAAALMTGRELPTGPRRLATWGPVTVAYKRAERSAVLDRPGEVLETAQRLTAVGTGQVRSTEFHRHRLDVAKAHVMLRQYGEAVEVLTEVHQTAPEWLSNQRYARDTMAEVIRRRRTLTPQMLTLADATGVPV